ncbi:AAA-ATPase ASD, mitochondrial-like [Heracleum sosnowskyi]|uniref:AAA-ATPase ASD, mitochondrial-like n=1 Tax=Heracleum sosnowskyi TaxID=360622 RepID=A0AAD8JG38_9APIA|nr:AAA-ATPase ASD, mitochondrial-like [Heracleum sosnowskyi]
MFSGEMWTSLGSLLASLMFVWAICKQYFPYDITRFFDRYGHKIVSFLYPYIQITFHEYSGDGFDRGTAYVAIQRYLAANSSVTARRLKADPVKDTETLVLSMDDHEEITDEYQGIKVWWASSMTMPKTQSISFYPREDDKRFYTLSFHNKYRDLITKSYLSHVLAQGKSIAVKNRQRKLYTNNKKETWSRYGGRSTMWSHVVFEHPASFETLALEAKTKKDIMNDLITFSKAKDYYAKVGKAWKRGYLLHGPPGTGKSTMIAAMANLLQYDVYDLELTSVKDNTELRKLLIETSGKSIIVIEDIDCSLDLTGQRKNNKDKDVEAKDEKEAVKKAVENAGTDGSKVTLSGLLNFIDGLWSSCGGERVIVFTTNYLEKLDPALIRRGRMDKHIEMSYCSFEAFKVLAKNYLDVESHQLFTRIEELLGETDMTPADVAENLMPKSAEEDGESCLNCLISAMEDAKVAVAKAEEEKLKAEEKEKHKVEKKEEEMKQKAGEELAASKDVKENGALVI